MTSRGQSWIKASYRFDEIGASVLERGRTDAAPRSLCLQLRQKTEVIPVAVGDEATLLEVHDRLMRALRPAKDRATARDLSRSRATRAGADGAFPMLAPSETEGRSRRV
jgi:hypothetical protein